METKKMKLLLSNLKINGKDISKLVNKVADIDIEVSTNSLNIKKIERTLKHQTSEISNLKTILDGINFSMKVIEQNFNKKFDLLINKELKAFKKSMVNMVSSNIKYLRVGLNKIESKQDKDIDLIKKKIIGVEKKSKKNILDSHKKLNAHLINFQKEMKESNSMRFKNFNKLCTENAKKLEQWTSNIQKIEISLKNKFDQMNKSFEKKITISTVKIESKIKKNENDIISNKKNIENEFKRAQIYIESTSQNNLLKLKKIESAMQNDMNKTKIYFKNKIINNTKEFKNENILTTESIINSKLKEFENNLLFSQTKKIDFIDSTSKKNTLEMKGKINFVESNIKKMKEDLLKKIEIMEKKNEVRSNKIMEKMKIDSKNLIDHLKENLILTKNNFKRIDASVNRAITKIKTNKSDLVFNTNEIKNCSQEIKKLTDIIKELSLKYLEVTKFMNSKPTFNYTGLRFQSNFNNHKFRYNANNIKICNSLQNKSSLKRKTMRKSFNNSLNKRAKKKFKNNNGNLMREAVFKNKVINPLNKLSMPPVHSFPFSSYEGLFEDENDKNTVSLFDKE